MEVEGLDSTCSAEKFYFLHSRVAEAKGKLEPGFSAF